MSLGKAMTLQIDRLGKITYSISYDMEIKTFSDPIDWTRQLHNHLAKCLAHCSSKNEEGRARLLLDYLAEHEVKMEKMVSAFEEQAEPKVMKTYISDYLSHQPIQSHRTCDAPYAKLGLTHGFDFDQHQECLLE